MAISTLGPILNVGSAVRPTNSNGLAANRSYQIVIDVQGDEALIKPVGSAQRKVFPISANLPERFHMEMSSNWTMPFDGATAGSAAGSAAQFLGAGGASQMIGNAVDAGLGAAGVGQKLKDQMIQVWESSSPLEMNFDLIFYAHSNTEREIKERHLALLKLCAPSLLAGTQVLEAPGPKYIDATAKGRQINVFVGNYIQLTNVIVRSVGSDLVSLFDDNGIPIGMSVNLSIATWNACVTGEDLEAIFYGGLTAP